MYRVPVVNKDNKPVMPTNIRKARRLINAGEATPFYKLGIFCIRMNREIGSNTQDIVCGIDTGIKREAFTIKSCAHTYLNIQTNTPNHIKHRLIARKEIRRNRRARKTPYKKRRGNRAVRKRGMVPSIKARWDYKINLLKKLKSLFNIKKIIIEDIKTTSKKNNKNWNQNFFPLQRGKKYGYMELRKLTKVKLIYGFQTSELRKRYGLTKIYDKLSDKFEAHCIDSWAMANSICEGELDNTKVLRIIRILFFRRQLHYINFLKGSKRKPFAGTRTVGLKKGTIAIHKKYGKCYIGGNSNIGISLHNIETGERICRTGKISDLKIITLNNNQYRKI